MEITIWEIYINYVSEVFGVLGFPCTAQFTSRHITLEYETMSEAFLELAAGFIHCNSHPHLKTSGRKTNPTDFKTTYALFSTGGAQMHSESTDLAFLLLQLVDIWPEPC